MNTLEAVHYFPVEVVCVSLGHLTAFDPGQCNCKRGSSVQTLVVGTGEVYAIITTRLGPPRTLGLKPCYGICRLPHSTAGLWFRNVFPGDNNRVYVVQK